MSVLRTKRLEITPRHAYNMGWTVGEQKAQGNPLPLSDNPFPPRSAKLNNAWADGYSAGYEAAVTTTEE